MSADLKNRKLIAAIESVKKLAEELTAGNADEALTLVEQLKAEGNRAMQQAVILSLAYITEEPTPISVFKPFASYAQFRVWEGERKITLLRKNRKVCVVPAQFFKLWRTVKDAPKGGK